MAGLDRLCDVLAAHNVATPAIICFALLLRFTVGLSSYSGAGKAPVFGDYEAQRHWMEITVHTPASDWYTNTSANNLSYWGLDYPPLTAYQSYLHGLAIAALEPEAVALGTSHGYETPSSKLLMRWTVISSDLLTFFPAALWFVSTYYRKHNPGRQALALALILLQPAAILIDHGHFQYNCISLGLAMAAAAAVLEGYEVLGSIFYCLSLNHKQMSAYYAPAFFAHLLGRSLQKRNPILAVARLGVTVILTFAVVWAPYLTSKEDALQVLSRLVPFQRGLFEDYVANFWCTSSLVVKWKQLLPIPALVKLAAGATLGAALPSMLKEIRTPTKKGFLLAMLNSSMAFFLFSFQVHEKSILLPLLPSTLLSLEEPILLQFFMPIATFSMYPLLVRDGLALPYIACQAFMLLLCFPPSQWSAKWRLCVVFVSSLVGVCLLHALHALRTPPKRLPYLHVALMTSFAFGHFILILLYSNFVQLKRVRLLKKKHS